MRLCVASLLWTGFILGAVTASMSVRDDSYDSDEFHDVSEDDDDRPHYVDLFGLENDYISLQKALTENKQKFMKLWRHFRGTVGEDAACFNDTVQVLRHRTRQLTRSLSRNFISINDLLSCITSCMESFWSDEDYVDLSQSRAKTTCNHNCILMMERHQQQEELHENLSRVPSDVTSTPPASPSSVSASTTEMMSQTNGRNLAEAPVG